jgi:hypothetical protein
MAVPTLAYRSKIWTITKKEEKKRKRAEMKFLKGKERPNKN